MKDGGRFAHPECYYRRELAASNLRCADTLGSEFVGQQASGEPEHVADSANPPAATDPAPEARELSDDVPEEVREWAAHMDLHLTEHDLRHAGLALRAAWPTVRAFILSQQQVIALAQGEVNRLKLAAQGPLVTQLGIDIDGANEESLRDPSLDLAALAEVHPASIVRVLLKRMLSAETALARAQEALRYWREECSGAEPSLSVFERLVDAALASAPSAKEGQLGEQSAEGPRSINICTVEGCELPALDQGKSAGRSVCYRHDPGR